MSTEKTVLVTGGAGYIGSHAVLALARAGVKVVVLDNLVYGHREATEWLHGVELYTGDIGNRELLRRIFAEHPIDAVMHFAAYAYVGESVTNPGKYYLNNVSATLVLLDEMVAAGILNFVFSSTCATYGVPVKLPLTEDHSQIPINPYGQTKLMVEKILADFDRAHGLKSVCFRYFNAAGADPEGRIGEMHDPETHLIPLVLDAASGTREFISIFGTDYETPDGTCIRDYIHVADLADAHLLGLSFLESEKRSMSFNLGNEQGTSVREIIDAAVRVTGKEVPVREADRREGDPPILVGSSALAERTLGWKPQFGDIETIVRHAWRWHQSKAWARPVSE